jgi:hypothetical protein
LLGDRTRAALESGALEPISTRVEQVDDGGGRFALRSDSTWVDRRLRLAS